jgi:hypothetical protein
VVRLLLRWLHIEVGSRYDFLVTAVAAVAVGVAGVIVGSLTSLRWVVGLGILELLLAPWLLWWATRGTTRG